MSTILNLANCNPVSNTGDISCYLEPDIATGLIFIPKGTVIPAADLATSAAFQTYLQARLVDNNVATRWYKAFQIGMFKDNTAANKYENQDEQQVLTLKPPYFWEYRFIGNANKCLHNIKMMGFHLKQSLFDLLIWDKNNVIWCTQGYDSLGNLSAKGFNMNQLIVNDWKQKTTSTANQYVINIQMADNSELNEDFFAVNCDFDIKSLQGIVDAVLYCTSPSAGTINIQALTNCNGQSLGALYGSELGLTAFTFYDNTTAAALTPHTVTYNAALDVYVVSFSSGVTTGDNVTATMATPGVIYGLVSNYITTPVGATVVMS
jgi:hypothetical protein